MTRLQLAVWIVAAVTVFWSVGAYNRLVSLRNRIAQAFAAVDAQIQLRHATLLRWLQAAPPPPVEVAVAPAAAAGLMPEPVAATHPPPPAESVQAAGRQLQSACDALRSRPSAARRAVSLRLAEQTLAGARARFGARVPGRAGDVEGLSDVDAAVRFSSLTDELSAADNTLGFACRQFNDTTAAYNDALRQLPTRLVGWLFGFHEAGTL